MVEEPPKVKELVVGVCPVEVVDDEKILGAADGWAAVEAEKRLGTEDWAVVVEANIDDVENGCAAGVGEPNLNAIFTILSLTFNKKELLT